MITTKEESVKRIVISGSAKLQKDYKKFVNYFKDKYDVVDYPVPIEGDFEKNYSNVHKEFYKCISKADTLLLLNMDKGNTKGFIGPSGFGELCIAIYLTIVENKDMDIYIYQLPDKTVNGYDEIMLWIKLGFIKVFDKIV